MKEEDFQKLIARRQHLSEYNPELFRDAPGRPVAAGKPKQVSKYQKDTKRPVAAHRRGRTLIVLKGERPSFSWNQYYAGMHWTKRKKEADRVHEVVQANLPRPCMVYEVLVSVTVTVWFEKNPFDSDNIPAKLYVDGLRGHLLVDDDRRYVKSVKTEAAVDKRNPRTEILIEEE